MSTCDIHIEIKIGRAKTFAFHKPVDLPTYIKTIKTYTYSKPVDPKRTFSKSVDQKSIFRKPVDLSTQNVHLGLANLSTCRPKTYI